MKDPGVQILDTAIVSSVRKVREFSNAPIWQMHFGREPKDCSPLALGKTGTPAEINRAQ